MCGQIDEIRCVGKLEWNRFVSANIKFRGIGSTFVSLIVLFIQPGRIDGNFFPHLLLKLRCSLSVFTQWMNLRGGHFGFYVLHFCGNLATTTPEQEDLHVSHPTYLKLSE